jgi:hypothetical protein
MGWLDFLIPTLALAVIVFSLATIFFPTPLKPPREPRTVFGEGVHATQHFRLT